MDSTVGYEIYSFMDAYAGYHHIRMDRWDEEKTSFITNKGTFYYRAMLFGLKNA